jgi:hypothetical protein
MLLFVLLLTVHALFARNWWQHLPPALREASVLLLVFAFLDRLQEGKPITFDYTMRMVSVGLAPFVAGSILDRFIR